MALTNADNAAHPRVSGENGMELDPKRPGAGSSPRERGKLAQLIYCIIGIRLIPA